MVSIEAQFNSIIKNHEKKSKYMWDLVNNQKRKNINDSAIPKKIIQFWDRKNNIPNDVYQCIKSWKHFQAYGIEHLLFDDNTARQFIAEHYDLLHVTAYDKCNHPAMRADYFRLCYILLEGGVYVDADDICIVSNIDDFIEKVFSGISLKVQALCYDIERNKMIGADRGFCEKYKDTRIYYVNNNPLIAVAGNSIIRFALDRATDCILRSEEKIDIQSITGPGNLTTSFIWNKLLGDNLDIQLDYEILTDWDENVRSEWPLEYRNDNRNWRNWDGSRICTTSEE